MPITNENLAPLLTELANWFEFEGIGVIDLLVCGGVAMGLQQLNHRTTNDLDVLGQWNTNLLAKLFVSISFQKM